MKWIACAFVIGILSACSLDYGKSVSVEDIIPEFRFADAHFSRYEDNKPTMEVNAKRIEQYKSDGSSYVQGASFKTYDTDGKIDTEGFCELLAADTKNEKYTMFSNIYVYMHSQDLKIRAETLRFDGKSEQLTSRQDESVIIEKKDTVITGRGFSASGVSKSFYFEDSVGGTVTTTDAQETEPLADESQESIGGSQ
ncbi:MAG: LPS export ABC transporter periplasmic protein LptC [Treponema sp.]|nr:LPS export ABC transporter periplasmic protein LptC [Treponema sp.]